MPSAPGSPAPSTYASSDSTSELGIYFGEMGEKEMSERLRSLARRETLLLIEYEREKEESMEGGVREDGEEVVAGMCGDEEGVQLSSLPSTPARTALKLSTPVTRKHHPPLHDSSQRSPFRIPLQRLPSATPEPEAIAMRDSTPSPRSPQTPAPLSPAHSEAFVPSPASPCPLSRPISMLLLASPGQPDASTNNVEEEIKVAVPLHTSLSLPTRFAAPNPTSPPTDPLLLPISLTPGHSLPSTLFSQRRESHDSTSSSVARSIDAIWEEDTPLTTPAIEIEEPPIPVPMFVAQPTMRTSISNVSLTSVRNSVDALWEGTHHAFASPMRLEERLVVEGDALTNEISRIELLHAPVLSPVVEDEENLSTEAVVLLVEEHASQEVVPDVGTPIRPSHVEEVTDLAVKQHVPEEPLLAMATSSPPLEHGDGAAPVVEDLTEPQRLPEELEDAAACNSSLHEEVLSTEVEDTSVVGVVVSAEASLVLQATAVEDVGADKANLSIEEVAVASDMVEAAVDQDESPETVDASSMSEEATPATANLEAKPVLTRSPDDLWPASAPSKVPAEEEDDADISVEIGRATVPGSPLDQLVPFGFQEYFPRTRDHPLSTSSPTTSLASPMVPMSISGSSSISMPRATSPKDMSDSNVSLTSLVNMSGLYLPVPISQEVSSDTSDLLRVPAPPMDSSMLSETSAVPISIPPLLRSPARHITPESTADMQQPPAISHDLDERTRREVEMQGLQGERSPLPTVASSRRRSARLLSQVHSPVRAPVPIFTTFPPTPLLGSQVESTLEDPSHRPYSPPPSLSRSFDASLVLPPAGSDNLFDVSMLSASGTIFGQSVPEGERPFPPQPSYPMNIDRSSSPDVPAGAGDMSLLLNAGFPDADMGGISEDESPHIAASSNQVAAVGKNDSPFGKPLPSPRRRAPKAASSVFSPSHLATPSSWEVLPGPAAEATPQPSSNDAALYAGPSTPLTTAPPPAGSRKARYTKNGVVVVNNEDVQERKAKEKDERRRKRKEEAPVVEKKDVDTMDAARSKGKEKENSPPVVPRPPRGVPASNAFKLSSKLASAVAATAAASRSPLRPTVVSSNPPPLPPSPTKSTLKLVPKLPPKPTPAIKKSQIARPASSLHKPSALPVPSALPRPRVGAMASTTKSSLMAKATIPIGHAIRPQIAVSTTGSPGRAVLSSGAVRVTSPRKPFVRARPNDVTKPSSPLFSSTRLNRGEAVGTSDLRSSHLYTSVLSPTTRALGSPMRVQVDSNGREVGQPTSSKGSSKAVPTRGPSPPSNANPASISSSGSADSNVQITGAAAEPARRMPSRAAKTNSPLGVNARSTAPPAKPRVPSVKKGAAPQAPGSRTAAMSEAELRNLTNRNTNKNQQYYAVQLDKVTIYRDGPRPPSPTSRIRTVADKQKEEEKMSREERAKRRGVMRGDSGDEVDDASEQPMERSLKHARGPGDDEDYSTPAAKKRRLASPEEEVQTPAGSASSRQSQRATVSAVQKARAKKAKLVRWDKALVLQGNGSSSPSSSKQKEEVPLGKGCLVPEAKAIPLDPQGNVPQAGQPPTDIERQRIKVAKFVFDDDPLEAGGRKTKKS